MGPGLLSKPRKTAADTMVGRGADRRVIKEFVWFQTGICQDTNPALGFGEIPQMTGTVFRAMDQN